MHFTGKQAHSISSGTPDAARRPDRPHGRFIPAILCLPLGTLIMPGSTDMQKPPEHKHDVPETAQSARVEAMPSDLSRIEIATEPTRAESLRTGFYRLGAPLKALLSLPFLLIGQAVLFLLKRAFRPAFGPVLSFLAESAFFAALLVTLFALVFKLLFPKRSLRELLKNGRWLWLLGSAFALTAFLRLIRLWKKRRLLAELLFAAVAFLLLYLLYKRLFKNVPPPERMRKWIELPRF